MKANQFKVRVLCLLENLPDCLILCNWVFDNFILADGLLAKALWSLETCILVNNNLCGKLVSSLELLIIFDDRFKVTSERFFITEFNILCCELNNFLFKVLYWVMLYWYSKINCGTRL